MAPTLQYSGSNCLRQRLLLATLAGKPVKISEIRPDDENPGLRDFEASLLRLLDKVTNGCAVHINETGTTLRYKPGQIVGGEGIVHECPPSRCVTYYLEVVAILALYAKKPLRITLRGVTNDNVDTSVDTFRTVTLPLFKHAGATEGVNIEIKKRGVAPNGGGEVKLSVPCVKRVRPFELVKEGKVKRVRGVAYTSRVTPQFAAKMVDSARNVLNDFLPDVWIYTDHAKGDQVADSPGYGLSLVAETIKGHLKAADFAADLEPEEEKGDGLQSIADAEKVGVAAATRLLQEIQMGGVTDSSHQWILVTLAALAEEDQETKLRLGKLTPYTVSMLRHLRDFFGVKFNFDQDEDAVNLSVIGSNLTNIARRTF